MKREYIDPIRTPSGHKALGDEITHPAYGAISANRVSGQMALFDSGIAHHNGYVTVSIRGAKMMSRDGHEHVHADFQDIVEVSMSEAQWVAFVSRMNTGGGTPCTITDRRDMDGTYHLIPGITQEATGTAKLDAQAAEFIATQGKHMSDALEDIKRIVGYSNLSKGKQDALDKSLLHIREYAKSTLAFYKEELTETNDKLVTSAKVEINAAVNAAVTRLGLTTAADLGRMLAADPDALRRLANEAPKQIGQEDA